MINIFEASKVLIGSNRKDIDHNLRELKAQLEQENIPLPETLSGAIQRVLKAYGMLKSLLTVLTMLPVLPGNWREGIKYLAQALDALRAASEREVVPAPDTGTTANFKAGRDLEPAA